MRRAREQLTSKKQSKNGVDRKVKKSAAKKTQPESLRRGEDRQAKPHVRNRIDSSRYKIKDDFPLLAGSYDVSSLATEISNKIAELFRVVVAPKIEEIKTRKKLSINEVQTDEEIIALLNQRDTERRRYIAALFRATFERKKRATDSEELVVSINSAIQGMKGGITYAALAKKLKEHSANALRVKMRRHGLSIKDFKKTNK